MLSRPFIVYAAYLALAGQILGAALTMFAPVICERPGTASSIVELDHPWFCDDAAISPSAQPARPTPTLSDSTSSCRHTPLDRSEWRRADAPNPPCMVFAIFAWDSLPATPQCATFLAAQARPPRPIDVPSRSVVRLI